MARIFISYKRVDKDKVLPLTDRIQKELHEDCWMDVDEIESDAQFVSVILKAIDEAEVFLGTVLGVLRRIKPPAEKIKKI